MVNDYEALFMLIFNVAFLGIVGIPALIVAYKKEKKRKKLEIGTRPFLWGYFLGYFIILFFTVGVIIVSLCLLFLQDFTIQDVLEDYISFAWMVILTYGAIGTIARNRIGFIIITIFGFPVLFWIINYFYIKNRWNELSTGWNFFKKHEPPGHGEDRREEPQETEAQTEDNEQESFSFEPAPEEKKES